MSTAGALGAGGGGGRVGCGAVLAFCDEASELKSRSMAVSSLPAGLAAAAAGPAAAPEDNPRMNPALSNWGISRWELAAYSLPLFFATAAGVALPSIPQGTHRCSRFRRLGLPQSF